MSTEKPTEEWTIVQDLIVTVAAPGPLDDQAWSAFLRTVRTEPIKKYLACIIGKVEASSIQRKQAAETFKSRGIRIAVVTDETIVRGLVTAVGWLGVNNISAFSWQDTTGALQYLDVKGVQAERALEAVAQLRLKADTKQGKR